MGTGSPGSAAKRPCPILDIHTPECGKSGVVKDSLIKSLQSKVSRRIFSRVMLGLLLPGRYYFLTLTTLASSPDIKKCFDSFRHYLRRERPGCSWIIVYTSEGNGVIHMVIRLKQKDKNFSITGIRKYWKNLTGATQIKIVRVRSARTLANYLSDQRKKRKMGSEMSWQDGITRWGWSKGWIPVGFTRQFGRLWFQLIDAPDHIRDKIIRDAIKEEYRRQQK